MTPELLASRPDEIHVGRIEDKNEAPAASGCHLVAEIDGKVVGHTFLEPLGTIAAISHVFTLHIASKSGVSPFSSRSSSVSVG